MKTRAISKLVPLIVVAIVAAACTGTSPGEHGAASAAPVVVPGNSSGKATYGGGYAGTNAKLLQGAPSNAHPTLDGGAGFNVQSYPATTLPGWKYGLPTKPALLSYRSSAYGPILTTSAGKTIYVRLGDSFRQSACTGICARAFPPVITAGAPQALGGVLVAYIGILLYNSKDEQVSYASHPLYTYSGDTAPGDIKAEGLGSIWYVIGTNGIVHETPIAASSTTSTTTPSAG